MFIKCPAMSPREHSSGFICLNTKWFCQRFLVWTMLQDGLKLSHRCVFPSFGWSLSKVVWKLHEWIVRRTIFSSFLGLFFLVSIGLFLNIQTWHELPGKKHGCFSHEQSKNSWLFRLYRGWNPMRIVISQYKDPSQTTPVGDLPKGHPTNWRVVVYFKKSTFKEGWNVTCLSSLLNCVGAGPKASFCGFVFHEGVVFLWILPWFQEISNRTHAPRTPKKLEYLIDLIAT